jgi:uncharacterized membrane protein
MSSSPIAAAATSEPAQARKQHGKLLAAGLLALTVIPVAAGIYRLTQLATSATITPENERFFTSPVPVVVHIVSITGYSVFGVFQFLPRFRRQHPGWHRVAGRILVPLGLGVALSGVWMTLFYQLPAHDSDLLNAARVLVAGGVLTGLGLGFRAIRRRDVPSHRAWMIRAYALAMGAGTQAFTSIPYIVATGEQPGAGWNTFLMILGWVINIVVAECVIRRSPPRRRDRRPLRPASHPVPALADREVTLP